MGEREPQAVVYEPPALEVLGTVGDLTRTSILDEGDPYVCTSPTCVDDD